MHLANLNFRHNSLPEAPAGGPGGNAVLRETIEVVVQDEDVDYGLVGMRQDYFLPEDN